MLIDGIKLLIFVYKQLTVNDTKGKTWSRGTNSRLPFGVNMNLYLSIEKHVPMVMTSLLISSPPISISH